MPDAALEHCFTRATKDQPRISLKRMHIIWIILFHSATATAQWQSHNWLHLGGAYAQRDAREEAGPGLQSTRVGARGELGLNLLRFIAVSAGGSYQDGGGSVTNSSTPHFAGYASDTRALVHVVYAPLVFSTGLAEYESFDRLAGFYRARTSFSYKPMMLTLNWGPAYLRLEQDLGAKGSITRLYSDRGGGRTDQKFKLPKTRGQGFEIGIYLPSVKYSTHLFLNYSSWTIDAGALVNDGVEDVRVGRTEIKAMTAGLGLAF